MPDYSIAFLLIGQLGNSVGAAPINQLPGCWEHQVDPQWWIAVNGHKEPKVCSHNSVEVKPFSAYVEYNGWPAGLLDPFSGSFSTGSGANEDAFIAALQAAGAELP